MEIEAARVDKQRVVDKWITVHDVVQPRGRAMIKDVLPKRLSQQDFQEYIVEFSNVKPERFRFCLYREVELRSEEDQ